jgi:hypothetical protein
MVVDSSLIRIAGTNRRHETICKLRAALGGVGLMLLPPTISTSKFQETESLELATCMYYFQSNS